MEVLDGNGHVSSDFNEVMGCWKDYFNDLLNAETNTPTDSKTTHLPMPEYNHIDQVQNKLHQVVINRDISISEIKLALVKAKNGKANGPDLIPVEVLRNDYMVITMHSLFNYCFK
jgi:hypothetical protein